MANLLPPPQKNSLALFVVLIGLYAVQVFYLMILNKKHSKTRESVGKKAVVIDRSMRRVRARSAVADGGGDDDDYSGDDGMGHHAFDDKTDWENEDFIFVY